MSNAAPYPTLDATFTWTAEGDTRRAGHGVGKPVGKRADEQADVLTFFSWQLGIE